MKILHTEEHQEVDVPISSIVLKDGSLNILPHVKTFFSVDYKPKNDKLSLYAGKFIGLIPINDDIAVEIRPKFSITNLTRIVSVAEDNFKALNFFSKGYKESKNFSSVVFEFMAESLGNELRKIDEEGLLKEYIFKTEDTSKIRGRININNSMKKLWSHGRFNKVSVTYPEFTVDNEFNRLIKYTLKFCIEELIKINSKKLELIEVLIDFYTVFDAVSLDEQLDSFDDVFRAIQTDKVSTLRDYYTQICEICRLIINRIGISFDESGGESKLNSFTLDMAITFENYLINSIRLNREVLPENTHILDGNKEGKKKLFNQPSVAKGDAKPDIILKEGDDCIIIADAKYKKDSKESDRYQVISHALSYNAKIAILILPKKNKNQRESLSHLGTIGHGYKIDLYEYYFNLSSDNLIEEEVMMTSTIATLMKSKKTIDH